jgi:hypothetical protein
MKRWWRRTFLTAITMGAILGSVLGTRGLKQAVLSTGDLYRVDTAGSQMESDLEYETQESRRAFTPWKRRIPAINSRTCWRRGKRASAWTRLWTDCVRYALLRSPVM